MNYLTLKKVVEAISTSPYETNEYGTKLTKDRIRKASADGMLMASRIGDTGQIKVQICRLEAMENFYTII